MPAKDLVFGASWLHGLVRRDVVWRGSRILVTRGTRIERAPAGPGIDVVGGAAAVT